MPVIAKKKHGDLVLFEGVAIEERARHQRQEQIRKEFGQKGFVKLDVGDSYILSGKTSKGGPPGMDTSVMVTGGQPNKVVARTSMSLEGQGTIKLNENMSLLTVNDDQGATNVYLFANSQKDNMATALRENATIPPSNLEQGLGDTHKTQVTVRTAEQMEVSMINGADVERKLRRAIKKCKNLDEAVKTQTPESLVGKTVCSFDDTRLKIKSVSNGEVVWDWGNSGDEYQIRNTRTCFVLEDETLYTAEQQKKYLESKTQVLHGIQDLTGAKVSSEQDVANTATAGYINGIYRGLHMIPENNRNISSLRSFNLASQPSATEKIGKFIEHKKEIQLKGGLEGIEVTAGILHEYGHAFQREFCPEKKDGIDNPEFTAVNNAVGRLLQKTRPEQLFKGEFGRFTDERPSTYGRYTTEIYAELYKQHIMGEGDALQKHIDQIPDQQGQKAYQQLSNYIKEKIKNPTTDQTQQLTPK